MAFSLTKYGSYAPSAPGQAGVLHYELADQGAAGTETDTGIAGLRFIRVRLVVKSGLANGNSFAFQVAVDNNASMASPEKVAFQPAMAFVTNDTLLSTEVFGVCQAAAGFRYFKIVGTDSGGTAVYDAFVDVW